MTEFCSGFGQYHSANHKTAPKPYLKIADEQIISMAKNPPSVDKSTAQWVIPSTLLSREATAQRDKGEYFAVWCDFDNHTELDNIKQVLTSLGCFYLAYSSRSSKCDHKKWRVIIFLATAANPTDWQIITSIINDKFQAAGIQPDRASERHNQVAYLPNRGEFYQYYLAENLPYLNWQQTLSAEIQTKKAAIQQQQNDLKARQEQSKLKASERMATGQKSPVQAFNDAYDVENCLLNYGYTKRGNKLLSPNSESGNPGVTVNDGKWFSSHASDSGIGKPTNGGCFGDPFDLFVYYECGGNYKEAVKKAGDMFTTADGLTLNKASQIEFMKQKNQPDYDDFPDSEIEDFPVPHSSPAFILVENSPNIQTDVSDDKPLAFDFPTFDIKHYYGLAGMVAIVASEKSEADIMAVYVSFLCIASALLGRHKYLQIGDSRHYARLFAVLAGASSRARKGTSFKPAKRILRRAEEIYNAPVFSDDGRKILTLAEGGMSSAEGLIYQVRDESEEKSAGGKPLWTGVDDKRLLVVEEEFANVLQMCKREGNTLSATLRRAWDGGDLAPMTKNNRMKSTNPHINVLAHITQFELKCLMSQSDIYNGLSNRFLWACVRRTKKLAFPEPMTNEDVDMLANELVNTMKHSEQQGEMKLSSQARTYWSVKYHEVSQDKHGVIGSITSRSEAYVMRLSLLFALLDCAEQIEQAHIEAACMLVEFCNKSVEFTFSSPAENEAGTDAEKLLNALSIRPLSQSDVSAVFSGHKKRSELMPLLNELQSMNKIKSESVPGSKKVIWMLTGKALKK